MWVGKDMSDKGWSPHRGTALIAALILVVLVGILGSTILYSTSTDLLISGNFRRSAQTFYAAEAGLAEVQHRLAGGPLSNAWYVGDLTIPPQSHWSAYVLTDANWEPGIDPEYDGSWTNFVPQNGHFSNTLIQPNSVQQDLAYWVKIRHKTEFDAEQAGHQSASPHYRDLDGSTIRHSTANRGELIRFGYPQVFSVKPEPFTSLDPTFHVPIEIITSYGQVEGAEAILQIDATHQPGPPIWGTVYVESSLLLSGSAIVIEGVDQCGILAAGRAPIALAPGGIVTGAATLTGNPSTPQTGPAPLSLDHQMAVLNRRSTTITGDILGVNLGVPSSPAFLYAQPLSGTLNISQVTGYGVLLIKGDAHIAAPFFWKGLVMVSGQVIFSGGLGSMELEGALYGRTVHVLNNNVRMVLDTCPIEASLRMLPLQVLSWRQLL